MWSILHYSFRYWQYIQKVNFGYNNDVNACYCEKPLHFQINYCNMTYQLLNTYNQKCDKQFLFLTKHLLRKINHSDSISFWTLPWILSCDQQHKHFLLLIKHLLRKVNNSDAVSNYLYTNSTTRNATNNNSGSPFGINVRIEVSATVYMKTVAALTLTKLRARAQTNI